MEQEVDAARESRPRLARARLWQAACTATSEDEQAVSMAMLGRPVQVEQVGETVGGDAEGGAGARVSVGTRAGIELEQRVVAVTDADEDSCACTAS